MSSTLDPDRRQQVSQLFSETVAELQRALAGLDDRHEKALAALAADVHEAWQAGGKMLICGNGGSAADSQHIAAELVGRFLADRPGYPAIALTTNSSVMTAVGNDYGFDAVFARQVQALGSPGDVLLVISTSGNSPNCVEAVKAAREKNLKVHGLLGADGGALAPLVDSALIAPSKHTPRIQEMHITMGHLLCLILESWMAVDD